MSTDHGARDHATWAASSTARNVHCPGALALGRFAPPQKESIHAARGTACHQISEKCLRTGKHPSEFLGTVEKTKEFDITIDDELVSSAEMYVDYVRERGNAAADASGGSLLGLEPVLEIEQRFSLGSLNPPFDAGGTGDAVIYFADTRSLEVVDLKAGMGIVDVSENWQLRTYGLGALLANSKLKVDTITVTIVQPRAPHKDGRIRSETFGIGEMLEWTSDLLEAMQRSKTAMDQYDAAGGNSVLLDEWTETWLKPGKCTFCPVEGQCPALRKKALEAAKVWLDDVGEPRIGNIPGELSPEQMGATLDMIPMLEDWIKAVRATAHNLAESGVEIPGYQLVEKIGNRKWGDETAMAEALVEAGIPRQSLFAEPELKSPAQIDKLLGPKRKALIEPFVVRPVTGTNLTSVNKTSRPAATPAALVYLEK